MPLFASSSVDFIGEYNSFFSLSVSPIVSLMNIRQNKNPRKLKNAKTQKVPGTCRKLPIIYSAVKAKTQSEAKKWNIVIPEA